MELQQALREAHRNAPRCVGWDQTNAEWVTYDPATGPPRCIEPQFISLPGNIMPIPVCQTAAEAFRSLIRNYH